MELTLSKHKMKRHCEHTLMTMLARQLVKLGLVQVDEVCGDILRRRANEIHLGAMDISHELLDVQVKPVC